YLARDPGGVLLHAALAAADVPRRAELLAAMAAAGLDPAAVAGSGAGARFVADLPVAEAAAAVARFGAWRPAGAAGAALFDRLAAADPGRLAAAAATLPP